MLITGCQCLECGPNPSAIIEPQPGQNLTPAASVMVRRVERQILPLLRSIRDADQTSSGSLLELRQLGFAREAGKLIACLERDTQIALR